MKNTKIKIIIVISFVLVLAIVLSTKKELRATTIEKINEENIYYLDIRHENIYHGNIKKVFSIYKTTILRIQPIINLSIKEEKIEKELAEFYFYNEEALYRSYRTILKKYALHDELEKIEIRGIPIKIAVVRSSRDDIVSMKKAHPNIKIIDEYLK